MLHTFDMPLTYPFCETKGSLRITYNDSGFLSADFVTRGMLSDRLPFLMLHSELFAPVMEDIKAAIENNKESAKEVGV